MEWSFWTGPKVHALVQSIKEKEKNYVNIFFLCNVKCTVCVLYEKTPNVLFSAGQDTHDRFSSPVFGCLLQAWISSGYILASCFLEERQWTTRWSLLMSEEGERWDGTIGLSMLRNLEMCPSSSFFLCHLLHGAHKYQLAFCFVLFILGGFV